MMPRWPSGVVCSPCGSNGAPRACATAKSPRQAQQLPAFLNRMPTVFSRRSGAGLARDPLRLEKPGGVVRRLCGCGPLHRPEDAHDAFPATAFLQQRFDQRLFALTGVDLNHRKAFLARHRLHPLGHLQPQGRSRSPARSRASALVRMEMVAHAPGQPIVL